MQKRFSLLYKRMKKAAYQVNREHEKRCIINSNLSISNSFHFCDKSIVQSRSSQILYYTYIIKKNRFSPLKLPSRTLKNWFDQFIAESHELFTVDIAYLRSTFSFIISRCIIVYPTELKTPFRFWARIFELQLLSNEICKVQTLTHRQPARTFAVLYNIKYCVYGSVIIVLLSYLFLCSSDFHRFSLCSLIIYRFIKQTLIIIFSIKFRYGSKHFCLLARLFPFLLLFIFDCFRTGAIR